MNQEQLKPIISYLARVICYKDPSHTIQDPKYCHKGCDSTCILCKDQANSLTHIYLCLLCKYPFCNVHYQEHLKANAHFTWFSCIKIIEYDTEGRNKGYTHEEAPLMIRHRRFESSFDNERTPGFYKAFGKILPYCSFMVELSTSIISLQFL